MIVIKAKNSGRPYTLKLKKIGDQIGKVTIEGIAPKWIAAKAETFSITHPDFNNAVTLITAELIRNGEIVSIVNTQRS